MLLIHGFAVLHIRIQGPSKTLTSSSVTCTVANVFSRRENEVTICPENVVFKPFADNVPFRAIMGAGKRTFRSIFSSISSDQNVYMQ